MRPIVYATIGAVVLGVLLVTWKGGALVRDGGATIDPSERAPTESAQNLASVGCDGGDHDDHLAAPDGPMPRLPSDVPVQFRPLVQGEHEAPVSFELRRLVVENFREFSERAELSDEQERVILRIMADAQTEYAAVLDEAFRAAATDDPLDLPAIYEELDSLMRERIAEVLSFEQRAIVGMLSADPGSLASTSALAIADEP